MLKNVNIKNKLFKLLICIVVILNLLLIFKIFNNHNTYLYINWKILLPEPSSVNNIYRYDFREGEDFIVWNYNSDKDSLAVTKKLQKMDDIKKVNELLIEYYSYLDDENKNKFSSNIDFNIILNDDNYYLYKTENNNRHKLLLIFVPKYSNLYIFNVVH